MFVSSDATKQIKEKRKQNIYENYIEELIDEAKVLDINEDEIIKMLKRGYDHE